MNLFLPTILYSLAAAVSPEADQAPTARTSGEHSEAMMQVALDKRESVDNRDRALAALAAADFAQATRVAQRLSDETNRLIRVRAAWILADADQAAGSEILRAMARERTGESVIAIQLLGRLRDKGSHAMLADLLNRELESPAAPGAASRISALTRALGEYANKEDAMLLARSVSKRRGTGDWVMVEAAGRAGGSEAIPILQEIFARSRGWTAMAAGLGLGRSGDANGLRYVRDRLADSSGDGNDNASRMTSATRDDPYGPKAGDFIRKHLGVPADAIFVPDLMHVVSGPQFSWVAKAQAWQALSRIDAGANRRAILELASTQVRFTGAVRLLVVHDEPKARTALAQLNASSDPTQEILAEELRRALSTTPRERRRWRETEGYSM